MMTAFSETEAILKSAVLLSQNSVKQISEVSGVNADTLRTEIIRLSCINIDFSRLLQRTLAVLGESRRRPPVAEISSAALSPETSDLRSVERFHDRCQWQIKAGETLLND